MAGDINTHFVLYFSLLNFSTRGPGNDCFQSVYVPWRPFFANGTHNVRPHGLSTYRLMGCPPCKVFWWTCLEPKLHRVGFKRQSLLIKQKSGQPIIPLSDLKMDIPWIIYCMCIKYNVYMHIFILHNIQNLREFWDAIQQKYEIMWELHVWVKGCYGWSRIWKHDRTFLLEFGMPLKTWVNVSPRLLQTLQACCPNMQQLQDITRHIWIMLTMAE